MSCARSCVLHAASSLGSGRIRARTCKSRGTWESVERLHACSPAFARDACWRLRAQSRTSSCGSSWFMCATPHGGQARASEGFCLSGGVRPDVGRSLGSGEQTGNAAACNAGDTMHDSSVAVCSYKYCVVHLPAVPLYSRCICYSCSLYVRFSALSSASG